MTTDLSLLSGPIYVPGRNNERGTTPKGQRRLLALPKGIKCVRLGRFVNGSLDDQEIKELKALLSTGATKLHPRRDGADLPVLDENGEVSNLEFNASQLRFLHNFSTKMQLKDAAFLSGWTEDQAGAFLRSDKMDRLRTHYQYTKASSAYWRNVDNWYTEMDHSFEEAKAAQDRKLAFEHLKEFGDRAVPKQSRNIDQGPTKIEIHINPEAFMAARERCKEKAIDTDVVGGEGALLAS